MTAAAAFSLDRHASSVSPGPQNHGVGPGGKATTSGKSAGSRNRKKERHKLRRAAGLILTSERVSNCGQKALGNLVTLHHSDGHSHYGGIETCGSVWGCPVCAAKITEGRREDIDAVLKAHSADGGTAFLATLTMPHYRFQSCRKLRRGLSTAFRKVKSGKAWITARERYGWLGDIRALEVTHGGNGWHPHLHVLILFKPGTPRQSMYAFGGWLFDAWARAIDRLGFGTCSKGAFAWDVVNAGQGAADYVSKWGAALELTKAHTKKGKDGRTPWQILADFAEHGRAEDEELFREYARAFKGARQLTWSRDLRSRYLDTEETPDDDLANEDQVPATHTATLTRNLFDAVVAEGITADVLTAQEAGGVQAALAVLTRYRIPWHLSLVAGLERGRMVPLISLGQSQVRSPP